MTATEGLEPWSELRREVDRLFDSVLSGRPMQNGERGPAWMPAMDVEETDDTLRLLVEVPGVEPSNLDITIDNGVLTVSGEKRYERKEGDEERGARLLERRYGRFQRSVTLPDYVDAERIAARHENGVVTIEMPKTAQSRRRRIEIAGGRDQQQQLVSGNGTETRDASRDAAREQQREQQRERQVA